RPILIGFGPILFLRFWRFELWASAFRGARARRLAAGAQRRRQASKWPSSIAACGLPTWPASCRMAGTSGSETKFFQPSASQSKIAQTRSGSLGSRNTVAPFEPCSRRLSAPFVEKIRMKRSTSATLVVASSILISSCRSRPPSVRRQDHDARLTGGAHGVDSLCLLLARPHKPMLDRIECPGGPGCHAYLGIDALDTTVRGLGRGIQFPVRFLRC